MLRGYDGSSHVVEAATVRLEGLHALKHALRFGGEVLDARTSDLEAVLALATDVCPDLLDRLAELLVEVDADELVEGRGLPSPVVATARRVAWTIDDLATRPDRPVVLLERPTHLGNLGACIRVAAAADAAGVLVLGDADPWHPMAIRGGAGLQFALPVLAVADLPTLAGRPLAAIDPEGVGAASGSLAGAVLAFGSERSGLSEDLLAIATQRVGLPMRAGVSSLNLATSVAAALYTLAPPTA